MPTDPSFQRFDFNGGAVSTTLASRALDTDIVIDLAAPYDSLPLAGSGKFASVTINKDGSNVERIYYTERVDNQLRGCLRGQDGTSAFTHEAGETVDHGNRAQGDNEANAVVVALGGEDGATAAKALADAFTPTNAANAIAVSTAVNAATQTWVPVYSSISDTSTVSSDGTPEARYYQIGKLVWFSINVHLRVLGGTGTGGVGITLPVAASLGAGNSLGQFANEGQGYTNRAGLNDSTHLAVYRASNVNGGVWDVSGTFSYFRVSGIYEAS